jgi:DNA-binding transcriptional MocR family regulator
MTINAQARFQDLLSSRARLAPPAPARPVSDPLYEFGAGQPDPASFPYDGLADATAHVMSREGPGALSYGEYQGYRGLRELVCEQDQEQLGPAEHRRERIGTRAVTCLQRLSRRGGRDDL